MIGVAKFHDMMKPILKLFSDSEYLESRQICKMMNQQFPLTDEEIARRLERGRKPDSSEEIQWALLYLTRAGLISNPERSIYSITDEGLNALSEDPEIIDDVYLSKYESFRLFRQSHSVESDDDQFITYNQQPTLLIGLGGFCSRIVDNIYKQTKDTNSISAFSVDTDVDLFGSLTSIPKNHFICMASENNVASCLKTLPNAQNWFPENKVILSRDVFHGASQVRAIARLLFENAIRQRKFDVLLDEINMLAKKCFANDCPMRVSVATSLVGGTGAGIFIQIALLIRDYIKKKFPSLNMIIHGELILPSNFEYLFYNSREMYHVEANAYAALKELNFVNECFFNNSSSIQLNYKFNGTDEETVVNDLPYDYCFLYEKVNEGNSFSNMYAIENAIIERLFSTSANTLNNAFVNGLRSNAKNRFGNLYGMISTEKISENSTIYDSDVFCSIMNGDITSTGKQILMITSAEKMGENYKRHLPKDTICIENIISSVTDTTITQFVFGLEISELEKIKYESGQYYLSYKDLISQVPQVTTPHLDKKWHMELHDIGEPIAETVTSNTPSVLSHKIPEDSFVFISYSSKEVEIANQLKHILETNGVLCWMAPQSIPAGSDYAIEIPKAIEKCKAFLLLLSDASQKSPWVPREVSLAISNEKIVVPFQIDNATIGNAFNFYLTNSQRISAYNRMTEAYKELLARLKDILA